METSEDISHLENKTAISAHVDDILNGLRKMNGEAGALAQLSDKVTASLSPADSNPLIGQRARVRRKLQSAAGTHHTLEVCLSAGNPLIVSALKGSNPELGSDITIVPVSTTLATEVIDLAQAVDRLDQLVLIQVFDAANKQGIGVRLQVLLPIFLKRLGTDGAELHFSALSIPRVKELEGASDLFASAIEARLVSEVFAGKVTGKVDFKLPTELASGGLVPRMYTAKNGSVRVYYSTGGQSPRALDAPSPSSSAEIVVKLTQTLIYGMFAPKVRASVSEAGYGLERFSLAFDPGAQLMQAYITASAGYGKYFGNVKVSAKGNAQIRQAVSASANDPSALVVKSVGGTVLMGDPWPSDVRAHMDTLIGGGVGVGLPDGAADLIWEFVKALGVKFPLSIPNQVFEERLSVSPLTLRSTIVRSSDLILNMV